MGHRAGADAVLLIAALLPARSCAASPGWRARLGLVPLIETHDAADLAKLAGADWELVGINNRDLRTFEVDLEHSIRRCRASAAARFEVAESGIAGRGDLERLAAAGFDAFLVGESLLLAADPEAKLRELTA